MSLTMSARSGGARAEKQSSKRTRPKGSRPARVAAQHRGAYVVYAEHGERPAEPAGRLLLSRGTAADLPGRSATGWPSGTARLPPRRPSTPSSSGRPLSRKAAGEETAEQVVAANVDVVLVVSAFGEDLNLRRLERYRLRLGERGAARRSRSTRATSPRILEAALAEVEAVAFGVLCTSSAVSTARGSTSSRRTSARAGRWRCSASGAGKSSLLTACSAGSASRCRASAATGRGGTRPRTASSCLSRVEASCSTRRACASWALERGHGRRRDVRRPRRARGRVPLRRLRPRDRAGLCGARRDRRGPPCRGASRELSQAPARSS